jgi:hypothetical protein
MYSLWGLVLAARHDALSGDVHYGRVNDLGSRVSSTQLVDLHDVSRQEAPTLRAAV